MRQTDTDTDEAIPIQFIMEQLKLLNMTKQRSRYLAKTVIFAYTTYCSHEGQQSNFAIHFNFEINEAGLNNS